MRAYSTTVLLALGAIGALSFTSACLNTPPVVPIPEDGGLADGATAPFDGSVANSDAAPLDGSVTVTDDAGGPGPDADAANGSDGSETHDGASESDASSSLDGAVAPVNVRVLTANGPEPGATVVFQDATGAVVTSAVTDGNGSATQPLAPGGQVTAVLGTASAPSLVTIVGVEPGDVLTILDTSVAPLGSGVTVTETALPNSWPDSTAEFALAAGPCQSSSESSSITLPPLTASCVSSGAFPLLATALAENSTELAFTYEKGIAALPDGGASDEGGPPALNLAMTGSWNTSASVSVSAANAPSYSDGIIAYGEITGGVAYEESSLLRDAPQMPDAGASVASFNSHAGYADFVQTEINALLNDTSSIGGGGSGTPVIALASRTPASSPALALDFAGALPPVLFGALASNDDVRPTLSWTTAVPTSSSAGTVSVLSWFSQIDSGDQQGTWTIVSPPTTSTVQAPALPAAVAALGPGGTNLSWGPPVIALLGGSLLPSYAVLRATSGSFWNPGTSFAGGYLERPMIPALPANGTLQLSAYLPEED